MNDSKNNLREPSQKIVEVNGTQLCFWEWEGDTTPILLSHATGFHGRCWDEVVRRLPENAHVFAVETRFHGRSGKEGEVSWDLMAEDMKLLIEALALKDILAVGHSKGGYLMAQCAAQLPERFRQLILVDPVIMPPKRYGQLIKMFEQAGDFEHPTARRRNEWASAEEMFQKFQSKKPFSDWDRQVLKDYCDFGLLPSASGDGLMLACPPTKEAQCYTMHDDGLSIHQAIKKISTPTILMRARDRRSEDQPFSFDPSPTWGELAEHIENCRDFQYQALSHFIPMEKPSLVARFINEAISS